MIIGELQINYNDAMRLSLNEVIIRVIGKNKQYEKEMHLTRLLMWEIRTKYLKKNVKITPEQIFPLSFDEPKKEQRFTKDQWEKYKIKN